MKIAAPKDLGVREQQLPDFLLRANLRGGQENYLERRSPDAVVHSVLRFFSAGTRTPPTPGME